MMRHENLDHALCHELEKLDKKYADNSEMSAQDIEHADKLYHALKCAETYYAMVEAEEDGDEEYYREPRHAGSRSSRSGGYPMRYIDPRWGKR